MKHVKLFYAFTATFALTCLYVGDVTDVNAADRQGDTPVIVAGDLADFWGAFTHELHETFGDGPQEGAYPPAQDPPYPLETYNESDRTQVREIQQRLTDAGYRPGPIDGLMGPRTLAAIERYQAAQGLPVDGAPSDQLLGHLRAIQPRVSAYPAPSPTATGTAGDFAQVEKWVSPQRIFSVQKPRAWRVTQGYTKRGATAKVVAPDERAGVSFELVRDTAQGQDCTAQTRGIIGRLNARHRAFGLHGAWATADRSRVTIDVSYTAAGGPMTGRYYCVSDRSGMLIMELHARQQEFAERKGLLLTILRSIDFADPALQKPAPGRREVRPMRARMVRRQAPDGSSRVMLPAHWDYHAGQGATLAGSEQDDAGFLFTSVEVASTLPVPGLLNAPYQRPRDAIRLILGHSGTVSDIQVIDARVDINPQVYLWPQFTGRQAESEVVTVRFRSKAGRLCLGSFNVLNFAPLPFSGLWNSIVFGAWAPQDRFAAFAPILLKVSQSYQINQEYVANHIRSGLDNLRRLQGQTQQAMQELDDFRHEQQLSWEENEARRDYTNWKFSQYMRDQTAWVSDVESGKVYDTDSAGTKDTWTGDRWEGPPHDHVHSIGRNPRYRDEIMTVIDTFELYDRHKRN